MFSKTKKCTSIYQPFSPLGRGLNIHTQSERERTRHMLCSAALLYARLRTHYVMAIMPQRRATSNDFLSPPRAYVHT
uniref:Uncharacterized protein n=1 Tax=Trichogramma kaykai TaxID=54128 RepID=A0ABD2W7Q9_9HYME